MHTPAHKIFRPMAEERRSSIPTPSAQPPIDYLNPNLPGGLARAGIPHTALLRPARRGARACLRGLCARIRLSTGGDGLKRESADSVVSRDHLPAHSESACTLTFAPSLSPLRTPRPQWRSCASTATAVHEMLARPAASVVAEIGTDTKPLI